MRLLLLPSLVTAISLLAITGCSSTTREEARPETAPIIVTVVGDETASLAKNELSKLGIEIVSTLDNQQDSSVIVVVLDSTVGPLPIHLEIAKSVQKRPAKDYVWIFTNTAMVDDQELLELEELECREIFNSQGLPGDEVVFGFDSPTARVSPNYNCPKGWNAIARHIRNVAR